MTISALEKSRPSDLLERNFELYRDLSVALQERITLLKKGVGEDAGCKETLEAVKAHHKALQTVLDLEASLVKRSKCWTDGGGSELDLAAARAEIVARLAARSGEG
jgi:hypothetical protein